MKLGNATSKTVWSKGSSKYSPDPGQKPVWSSDGQRVAFELENDHASEQFTFAVYDTKTATVRLSQEVDKVDDAYPSDLTYLSSSGGFAFLRGYQGPPTIDVLNTDATIRKLYSLPPGDWSILTVGPSYAVIAGNANDKNGDISNNEAIVRVDDRGVNILDANISDPQIAPAIVDQGVVSKDGDLAYMIVGGAANVHSPAIRVRKLTDWSKEPSITLPNIGRGNSCDGVLGIQWLPDGSLVAFLEPFVASKKPIVECDGTYSQIQAWAYKNHQWKRIRNLVSPPEIPGGSAGIYLK